MDKTLSAAELPRLAVQLPDGKEVHHAIVGSEVTIGRDPSNRIPISDHFVSKFHAKILVSDASMTLVDLGSANKTYVNGRQITESPVGYGDEVQFASVRCRILPPENDETAVRPAPPPPAGPAAKPAPSPSVPSPPSRPAAPARAKPAPRSQPSVAAVQGRSGPPPIEADPMKRLLRIGGLLILVSAALGVLLRVLLVPSATEAEDPAATSESAPAATVSAPAVTETTTASPAEAPPATTAARGSTAEDYFDQALSYLDTGRLKEARGAFQKVLELDPGNSRAQTRLSLLEEEIAQKAERHFGNARQAFQYLRYEESIAEWEIFLTLADSSDVRYAEAEQGIAQAKAKLR